MTKRTRRGLVQAGGVGGGGVGRSTVSIVSIIVVPVGVTSFYTWLLEGSWVVIRSVISRVTEFFNWLGHKKEHQWRTVYCRGFRSPQASIESHSHSGYSIFP